MLTCTNDKKKKKKKKLPSNKPGKDITDKILITLHKVVIISEEGI